MWTGPWPLALHPPPPPSAPCVLVTLTHSRCRPEPRRGAPSRMSRSLRRRGWEGRICSVGGAQSIETPHGRAAEALTLRLPGLYSSPTGRLHSTQQRGGGGTARAQSAAQLRSLHAAGRHARLPRHSRSTARRRRRAPRLVPARAAWRQRLCSSAGGAGVAHEGWVEHTHMRGGGVGRGGRGEAGGRAGAHGAAAGPLWRAPGQLNSQGATRVCVSCTRVLHSSSSNVGWAKRVQVRFGPDGQAGTFSGQAPAASPTASRHAEGKPTDLVPGEATGRDLSVMVLARKDHAPPPAQCCSGHPARPCPSPSPAPQDQCEPALAHLVGGGRTGGRLVMQPGLQVPRGWGARALPQAANTLNAAQVGAGAAAACRGPVGSGEHRAEARRLQQPRGAARWGGLSAQAAERGSVGVHSGHALVLRPLSVSHETPPVELSGLANWRSEQGTLYQRSRGPAQAPPPPALGKAATDGPAAGRTASMPTSPSGGVAGKARHPAHLQPGSAHWEMAVNAGTSKAVVSAACRPTPAAAAAELRFARGRAPVGVADEFKYLGVPRAAAWPSWGWAPCKAPRSG